MMGLPLAFTAPAVLIALAALPVIWWLLRITPPRPQILGYGPTRSVVRQIVGEVLAMVSLVVLVGLVLVAQLPLFGVARIIGGGIFLVAVAAAVVFLYLLAGLAALAPAALAARIQPADALRTE